MNIDVSGEGKAAVSTNGEGNVSIELDGDNTLKSGYDHAGLEKNNGGSLTIADKDKNGKLTAKGGYNGAGIGGGSGKDGSDITISGGEVEATGVQGGAGIGGGTSGGGKDIKITGGEVNATGDYGGAGIGGGFWGAGSGIIISGGEVRATGGFFGAGIGGGYYGSGSDITISGGEVKATGGENGAGIGGGVSGKGEGITVSGNTQLKVQGGIGNNSFGTGAGIGNGGSYGTNGAEAEPDTSDLLTTGWIKYYAPSANMEKDKPTRTTFGTSSQPEKPIDPGAERGMDAPLYRVTDRDGRDIAYTAEQKGGVLTVTVDEDFAVLTGRLSGMTALRAQGVEKIIFVTNGAKTAVKLSTIISKLTANGVFRLTHDGKAVTFTLG